MVRLNSLIICVLSLSASMSTAVEEEDVVVDSNSYPSPHFIDHSDSGDGIDSGLTYNDCAVETILGCYYDNASVRILPFPASFTPNPHANMSQELCAGLCADNGYEGEGALCGVEYGSQCFCSHNGFAIPDPEKLGDGSCDFPCQLNHNEHCGGSDAIIVFNATCKKVPGPRPGPPPPPPNFHGCLDPVSQALPYCDPKLSHAARAQDLISRLSLNESISILSPTVKPFCQVHTPTIPNISFPRYRWLTEVNSVVDAGCLATYKCPTSFIGPTGHAASFNRTAWYLKGDVVSTDMRILNNLESGGVPVGLTGYGPNINTVKDPRYGRNSELPGEDPFLTGTYASQYIQGMQQMKDGYMKMIAYVKHYTAYSVETDRFEFKANVTQFDFWDSFLPQYAMAFTEGNASGAMCSYFAPNGVSCCGNKWLLTDVMRKKWNRPDSVIMSDCSAVANMMKNGMVDGPVNASAAAMNAGLDVYGGWNDDLWGEGYLAEAVKLGLVQEATIQEAVRRTFTHKLKVGLFDPLKAQPYVNLGLGDMNTTYAQQVAYEAALQSFVLLKNDKGTLPLKTGSKIAVVGPFATDASLYKSDYSGAGVPTDMPSIADAITLMNKGGTTIASEGVKETGTNASKIPDALSAVGQADVTVLCLGISKTTEHEGVDRHDTNLTGLQESFAHQVLTAAKGKPVVLITVSGGILSIDSLVDPVSAYIDAFNPYQQGPPALAATLFGIENRFGKLPVTIYPGNYSSQLAIQDMEFAKAPGRSYRYYNSTPLFHFGQGMSYTTFTHQCTMSKSGTDYMLSCDIKNTGSMQGDEIIQVYHAVSDTIKKQANHPVPIKRLVQFDRVSVSPGGTSQVKMTVPQSSFELVTQDGTSKLYSGTHYLITSNGDLSQDQSITVNI